MKLDSGKEIELNILSDYVSGTRLHKAGNKKMAITMFRQGVAKGDPKSMFALGTYYYFGEGLTKDVAEARKLFQTAVDQGNAEAAYFLSQIHGNGDGVPVDTNAALGFMQKAAFGCVAKAQSELSQMYYGGKGVTQDKLNGIAWLALAADDEDQETRDTVAKIKLNLNPDERKRVADLEKQYRATLKCQPDDE